jgi:hypothetical protein
MTAPSPQPDKIAAGPPAAPPRRARRGEAAMAIAVVAVGAAAIAGYYYYPGNVGAEQPIPFSHRFHVGEKRLSCVFCHTGALWTDHAGLPPLQTCMLCHSRIIIENPHIRRLREHYESNRAIAWARVNNVPDFVYFSHEAHTRRGFDCGRCHGDVAGMDRLTPAPDLLMGFCVQCHRDNQGSHDCMTCHR